MDNILNSMLIMSFISQYLPYDDLAIFKRTCKAINKIVEEETEHRYKRGIYQIMENLNQIRENNFLIYGEAIDRILDNRDSIYLFPHKYHITFVSNKRKR